MDLKKKFRAFFTLTRKADGGFTLVELIVVIAIMAVLAGVAVPAYSGYITKANTAADEQLLAALNTAFAAACNINGENHIGRNDVSVSLTGGEGEKEANVFVSSITGFADSFASFYEEGGKFKLITELYYNAKLGTFAENKSLTFKLGDKEITLSSKDVEVLSGNNAFSERGSEALLGDIGVLQTYLTGLDDTNAGDILSEVGNSSEFFAAMGGYLGLKEEDYPDQNAYREAIGEKIEELEKTNPDITTNALIMYSASHAANASQEQIDKLFTGTVTGNIAVMKKDENGNAITDADGNPVRDNEATMANAALAYGMYTAYAQRNNLDVTEEGNDFVNIVTSPDFKDYISPPLPLITPWSMVRILRLRLMWAVLPPSSALQKSFWIMTPLI